MKSYSGQAAYSLIGYIKKHGTRFESERGPTIELIGAQLKMSNPRDRVDPSFARKLNLPFAFAEFVSLLSGEDDIRFFTQFISGYAEYSSDGETLDGAYGKRLVGADGTWQNGAISQAIELLKHKPATRRAVISIYKNGDLTGEGKLNTPCTLTIQFMIRDGALNMFVNMRSNDVIFGLGNDVVVFTMLHEFVADAVGVKLGEYFHNAASLHIYEDSCKKLEERRAEATNARFPHLMNAMNGQLTFEGIDILHTAFKLASTDETVFASFVESVEPDLTPYMKNMMFAARAFCLRKIDTNLANTYYNMIGADHMIRRIMRMWVPRLPNKE